MQEYPSFPLEAFAGSSDGFFYLQELNEAKASGRICKVPYQASSFVYTAWDIGYSDFTSIWFFQLLPGGAVHVIDFYEDHHQHVSHYVDVIRAKPYAYGKHYLPHDAASSTVGGESVAAQIRAFAIPCQVLEQPVKAKTTFSMQVQHTREMLTRCYFDAEKCALGLKHLENYRKRWNESIGCYTMDAVHDDHSHAADAIRYMAEAQRSIKNSDDTSIAKDREKIRKRAQMML
jgi:hypothetical protein